MSLAATLLFLLCLVRPVSAASLTYLITVCGISNTLCATHASCPACGFVVDMLPVSSKDFLFDAQANVFGPCKGVLNWNTTLGSGPSNQGTNNFPAKNCFSSTLVTSAPSETFDVFCLCGGFRGTLTYVLPTVAAPNGAPTTFTVSFTNASHETETDKFTFRATVVPEPATWLVLTVGGGLLWRRLRHHDRTEV